MKKTIIAFTILMIITFTGCLPESQTKEDSRTVNRQQKQYAAKQPIPVFNWSLERHLVVQLYNLRNMNAVTYSVWRSNYGIVEGDCASIGFGIPYDTSITNPLAATSEGEDGYNRSSLTSIEQPEPNGLFSSKNTTSTWVMCAGSGGMIEPVYVESKVTVYPYPVSVDYGNNRVEKSGKASVTLKSTQ